MLRKVKFSVLTFFGEKMYNFAHRAVRLFVVILRARGELEVRKEVEGWLKGVGVISNSISTIRA